MLVYILQAPDLYVHVHVTTMYQFLEEGQAAAVPSTFYKSPTFLLLKPDNEKLCFLPLDAVVDELASHAMSFFGVCIQVGLHCLHCTSHAKRMIVVASELVTVVQ